MKLINRGTAPLAPALDHGSERVAKRKAVGRFGALGARPRRAVALVGGALLLCLNSLKLGLSRSPGSLSRVPERFADDVADVLVYGATGAGCVAAAELRGALLLRKESSKSSAFSSGFFAALTGRAPTSSAPLGQSQPLRCRTCSRCNSSR